MVLGPLLRDLIYDGVLRIHQPKNVKTIAYADDLLVVAVAKHLDGCANGLLP